MVKPNFTPELLRELVDYDPETGLFSRKKILLRGNMAKLGRVGGVSHSAGYLTVCVCARKYLAHRLAWYFVYGEWPNGEVDHIDGDRTNNRIGNLRIANSAQNKRNAAIRKDNTTGFKGVGRYRGGRWSAKIHFNGKPIWLGAFETPEQAAQAYNDAAARLFGDFASPNRIIEAALADGGRDAD